MTSFNSPYPLIDEAHVLTGTAIKVGAALADGVAAIAEVEAVFIAPAANGRLLAAVAGTPEVHRADWFALAFGVIACVEAVLLAAFIGSEILAVGEKAARAGGFRHGATPKAEKKEQVFAVDRPITGEVGAWF